VRLQPLFPGDQELERRIKSLIRWNALPWWCAPTASSTTSAATFHVCFAATLYEVDSIILSRAQRRIRRRHVYFQGHASPGCTLARFGRPAQRAEARNFRRELKPGGGLSSYPHPWLMPDFWEFPTVSMGLSPLMAIYQARFNRYLEDRGMKPATDAKVVGVPR